MDATIRSYRTYAQEAIRNWVKGRRKRKTPPFLRAVLKQVCRPTLSGEGRMYVLDAGCGPGLDSMLFARAGCDVVGVDAVPEFVSHARRAGRSTRFKRPPRFLLGDFTRLRPHPRSMPFNLIWANASLIHLRKKNLPRGLKRLSRLLGPGGVLAATFFHGKGEGKYLGSFVPGRFFARYLRKELHACFTGAGWHIQSIRTVANEDRKGRWLNVIAMPL